MPELPEVETIRRALAIHAAGRRVQRVRARPVQMRRPLDPAALATALTGRRMTLPRRRGKYLLLDVAPEGSLLVHLGMSGRLAISDPTTGTAPHTHLVLELDNNTELRLVDPRRFGFAQWLGPGEEQRDRSLKALGLEPLDPALPEILPGLLRTRRVPVKSLLLDQRLVAGVGNIYATEALWRAGIRPSRAASRISERRLQTLVRSLQEVLSEAIAQGGTTLRDFMDPSGELGYFAFHLQAYGREGLPCVRCTAALRRSVIAGRSTSWCPGCQR